MAGAAETGDDGAGPSAAAAPPPPPGAEEKELYSYVVTAHRPSAVHATVTASLTSETDINLIISKVTRMEIHRLTPEGIVGIADVPIYGRIKCIRVFRPAQRTTDSLLVVTERARFFILTWDAAAARLVTVSSGDASEVLDRLADTGPVAAIDPSGTVAAIHAYDGMLRVIVLDGESGAATEQFKVRLDDVALLEMRFASVPAAAGPVLMVVHYDNADQSRTLKTYVLSVEKQAVLEGPWPVASLAAGAAFVLPLSERLGGGALIAAEGSISHVAGAGAPRVECTFPPVYFQCWATVGDDDTRFLIGDHTGGLHLVTVAHDDSNTVVGLSLRSVGVTTSGSALSYLDSGVCFVGSTNANSQLIKLLSTPLDAASPNNFVQVLQEFTNLGPISDFEMVDLDRIGQSQMVACCNSGRFGALRLIRNGIGISEQASIDLEGVRGIWSVKASAASKREKYLVITFVAATHVLAMNAADELDEAPLAGFATDQTTLFCGALGDGQIVQVTQGEVRLIAADSGALLATSASATPLTKAVSAGGNQVLTSTGKGQLVLLEASQDALRVVAETDMAVEVACLDAALWTMPDGGRLAAVGTWASHLLLVSLPALERVLDHDLETTVIPRSALFMEIATEHAVLLGMGDGQLVHWKVSTSGALTERKAVSIGIKPITLARFTMHGAPYVFAATDRPAIVHERGGKLAYSPVNETDVMMLCAFSTDAFPGALALAKDDSLMIVQIDAIQKLHIRTVQLGDHPRRLAHQASTSTFGVITLSPAIDKSFVRIFSHVTWEEVAVMQLDTNEIANSISSIPHPDVAGEELFVVATAYIIDTEPEPTKGRLLLFRLSGSGASDDARELRFLGETTVMGSAYQACSLGPGLVVATVNSKVAVFTVNANLQPGAGPVRAFELEVKKSVHTVGLYVTVHGDTIVAGDMSRSVSVLQYRRGEKQLEVVAEECEPRWTTAVAAYSDTLSLAADNEMNLVALRFNDDADDDATRAELDRVSQYNLGDFVNRIREGSLVMQLPDAEFAACRTFIIGSLLGMISLAVMLPKARFEQLAALQAALQGHIKGVGGLSHEAFRSHHLTSATPVTPAVNVVDGDLVELLLDLPTAEVERVLEKVPEGVRMPLAETVKLVEDLQRLH